MYATAHRVISPRGVGGINAFLHMHGSAEQSIDWSVGDIDLIASRAPGSLVAEQLQVVPTGGNRVLSYFDIACSDDIPTPRIIEAVRHMEKTLTLRQRPSVRRYPPNIVARFDYVGGLGEAESREFAALRVVLESILRQRPRPAWMDKTPMILQLHPQDDSVVFRLDEPSRQRTVQSRDVQLPRAVIHMDVDALDVFERLHGDLIRQILPSITGMSLERVREEGGARVVRATDQKLLWEWPRRV